MAAPEVAPPTYLELYGRTEQRYPLVLTEDERTDLLEFLQALTSR
jgi:hypothetical protein